LKSGNHALFSKIYFENGSAGAKSNIPLCQRGIEGDLIALHVEKSPLAPLFQRGEIRFQKANQNNIPRPHFETYATEH
jgi:hypothetical protein